MKPAQKPDECEWERDTGNAGLCRRCGQDLAFGDARPPECHRQKEIKMERNLDREAAIILNDLSSLVHRVEMLQANPHYTNAGLLIQKAYLEIGEGRTEIHQAEISRRFAGAQ